MPFLVFTMKSHQQIVTLAVLLILCEINFIIGASFTTENSEEDCPKNIEFECQQKDLYCCAKTGNQCCSEEDYFDQFPKLENSHAEPRSIVKGLFKIIGIIIGAALFVTGVCCVCCFCCPFCLCAKHRKGTVLRSGAEQIPPEQPQPQQQPLYHQPPVQPPPPQGGYPQQQPGYQPVATYPDNPPPYPGPPLENQAVAPPFAAAPPLTKSDYDRQPAYNPN